MKWLEKVGGFNGVQESLRPGLPAPLSQTKMLITKDSLVAGRRHSSTLKSSSPRLLCSVGVAGVEHGGVE